MENSIKLVEELNILSKQGIVSKDIPDFIVKNLNPKYPIREYQKEAFARFRYYLNNYQGKKINWGKKWPKLDYVKEFEKNLKDNLIELRTELLFHSYSPKPLKTFILMGCRKEF